MNQLSSANTMKLSMIVTITSCAPNLVLRYAGTDPTAPPARPAAIMHIGKASTSGVPTGSASPVSAAANPPAASWLSLPILNKPARRPNETARPVKARVVALYKTWPKP